MGTTDPLAKALAAASPGTGGTKPRVLVLFGDRPAVLDAIREARVTRHVSYGAIARILSADGQPIGEGSVKTWLRSEGIE